MKRASISILLNVAEGSGRFTKPDRKNFFVISRSSVFECIAIIDLMKQFGIIDQKKYSQLHASGEELSKMLYALISKNSTQ